MYRLGRGSQSRTRSSQAENVMMGKIYFDQCKERWYPFLPSVRCSLKPDSRSQPESSTGTHPVPNIPFS